MNSNQMMQIHERTRGFLSGSFRIGVLCVCLLSTPVSAIDGVLEINQACAVETGCFSGDSPGFPVTIDGTAGTSYQLTSDLVVPEVVNTDAILVGELVPFSFVGGIDIAIDLNNFSITSEACDGSLTNCAGSSVTGNAINTTSITGSVGLTVRDGSVVGMGLHGLNLHTQSRVSNVHARWNSTGIWVGKGSVVSGCTLFQNRGAGIFAEAGSTVTGNSSRENLADGISAGFGSTASDNAVFGNQRYGIRADHGSTVSRNAAYGNLWAGIRGLNGAIVANNAAYGNGGSTAPAGRGNGIEGNSGTLVQNNSATQNTGFGLRLTPAELGNSAYRENVINGNTAGTVTGGVNMFSNSCNGTAVCP